MMHGRKSIKPSMDVFCNFLMSCFPDILFRNFLSNFWMISAVPGNTFVFRFLIRRGRIARSFYFTIFRLQTRSLSHLLKLQCLLTEMFLFRYRGLWCPVYCFGWICRFSVVDSTIWLHCIYGLFLLTLIHALTSDSYRLLPLFIIIIIITRTELLLSSSSQSSSLLLFTVARLIS
jgi:hypothetical protein